ncbi:MAG: hypothetical protein IPG12_03315 [Saprospiraceae bacterium]|nr:hypothetical protein [Saprospiraceae bacterium]
MKKRIFQFNGTIPKEIEKDIEIQREFLEALKQKDENKLLNFGLDMKLIENGLRILKAKG